jgi:hypothetical protein
MKHRLFKSPRNSVMHFFLGLGIVSVLVCISIFSGCEKREIIEPTEGMDSARELWIRVLLFDNIRECIVTSRSGFNVIDGSENPVSMFTTSKPVKVSINNVTITGYHVINILLISCEKTIRADISASFCSQCVMTG